MSLSQYILSVTLWSHFLWVQAPMIPPQLHPSLTLSCPLIVRSMYYDNINVSVSKEVYNNTIACTSASYSLRLWAKFNFFINVKNRRCDIFCSRNLVTICTVKREIITVHYNVRGKSRLVLHKFGGKYIQKRILKNVRAGMTLFSLTAMRLGFFCSFLVMALLASVSLMFHRLPDPGTPGMMGAVEVILCLGQDPSSGST